MCFAQGVWETLSFYPLCIVYFWFFIKFKQKVKFWLFYVLKIMSSSTSNGRYFRGLATEQEMHITRSRETLQRNEQHCSTSCNEAIIKFCLIWPEMWPVLSFVYFSTVHFCYQLWANQDCINTYTNSCRSWWRDIKF